MRLPFTRHRAKNMPDGTQRIKFAGCRLPNLDWFRSRLLCLVCLHASRIKKQYQIVNCDFINPYKTQIL